MVVKNIIEKFLDETSILDYGTQRNDLEFKKFCRLRLQKVVGTCAPSCSS